MCCKITNVCTFLILNPHAIDYPDSFLPECARRTCKAHQLEEVDELVGVFSSGEVDKVPRYPVAQAGAGLHRHLAGGVAERRPVLHAGSDRRGFSL